jgi:hypothetical protein
MFSRSFASSAIKESNSSLISSISLLLLIADDGDEIDGDDDSDGDDKIEDDNNSGSGDKLDDDDRGDDEKSLNSIYLLMIISDPSLGVTKYICDVLSYPAPRPDSN